MEDSKIFNINVCDENGAKFVFKLKANQPIEKIMKVYADLKQISDLKSLRFL
jgi:hypothetical protein